MKSSKVLHLVLKGDGLTEVVAEDINIGLVQAGCDVTMAYLRDKNDDLPVTNAQRAFGLGVTSRNRYVFDWLASRKLNRVLQEDDYDVVISHRYKPCLLLMKLVKKSPGVEFVNVVHGTGHYDKSSRKRAIVRLAHERFRFVCVSEAVAEFISGPCSVGQTQSPIEVIPNGIDIQALDAQQLNKEAARRELGLDAESLWIGFAGRLVEIKGVVELVEGFATVADRFPRAKLAILGKGELREKLKGLISTKNLTERVMLLGQVPQAKKYFKAFDGFVLPSYREGMSIALLEAMATGLPVLVSDIPMNTTVVDQNAIVFEPRSSESVANALTSFLSADPQEHINHGESNRQLVEKNYTLQLFRSRYADLVRRLTLGDVS